MLSLRAAADRGHANHGWLDSHHTFSFADYYDPEQLGYRALRVINDDRVAPGQGFGSHPHRDMEILSYVLEGQLEHRDSLGNGAVIGPGQWQHISAGAGVTHSEFNPSPTEPVHFYQIWIKPRAKGLTPRYAELDSNLLADARRNLGGGFALVASPDGAEGSLPLEQDAHVWLARLEPSQTAEASLGRGRGAWLQVLRGDIRIEAGEGADHEELTATEGDGVTAEEVAKLRITALSAGAEVMLFDLP
ncbi:pirin family protein [Botrimarina hoheduenensis]|uniref:Quercetin 2,3-dioxygenase n=1 Tax=Botrimarina hoheduenensis TaxID=2528000 RepID=A0A5C5WAV8_9BACT|nr:pirin family protein [Botrimarina hoheduenensis]TWT47647.1 Quercetin 2,3-dioxygenase [Botrimarina hoheduenensis]